MRIEPGLARITAPNPGIMTWDGTNQYVVGERALTLIDCPIGSGRNREWIEEAVAELGAEFERVIVTHIHPDHLGGAREIADAWGVPLGMHASRSGYEGVVPDFTFDDGDALDAGGIRLEVVHTPGHESGHCCFWAPDRGWLFTGDHVVGAGTVVIAPPDGDMKAYLDSLERLHELGARRLFGGHGPPVEDPNGKIREYVAHRTEREEQVRSAVEDGCDTVDAVVARVYRDVDAALHPIAAYSVAAHLEKLEAEGRVSRVGSGPSWRPR